MSASFDRRRQAQRLRTRTTFLRVEALEERALLSGVASGLTVNPHAYSASGILVSFKPGNAPEKVLPAGAAVGKALPLVPGLYQVDLQPGLSVERALAKLAADPRVAWAEPDYQVRAESVPNEPSFSNLWGLNNVGQSGGKADADIDAPEAWNLSTGSGQVTVAVIDSGVDYNHPDLAANIWTNGSEIAGNGQDDDGNGFVDDVRGWDWANGDNDPMDDHSHGTHVAGTIGAVGNNGIGVAGVSWNVKLMSLKFINSSGTGSTSDAISALNYAVGKGASISNNSWGGGGFSQSLYNAINNAKAAGHIFVAASGNSGRNNDGTPFYPASYDLPNIVAVAATDRLDALAAYSNYSGTAVDMAAPGSSIYSTIPVSMGSYGYKSGTSMATPHVAGALALLRDVYPGLSYSEAINQVFATLDPLPSLAGKTATGGRLNLASALGGVTPTIPDLSISDVSITEGNSGTVNAVFTVSLSSAATGTVAVNYATADGTGSTPGDYTAGSGTLTFAAGATSQTLSIAIRGDNTVEANETFFVNLTNLVGATLADGQGVATILNDDAAAILVDNVAVTEGNSGTLNAVFTVTLSTPSSLPVTVAYATADVTATAGSDYVGTSGTLTFAPGQTSQTIAVVVNGDSDLEGDETLVLNLSDATGATIAVAQGTGKILDDDAPLPALSINDVSVSEGNAGTVSLTFVVTLTAASNSPVTVTYTTSDGTAAAPGDYAGTSGTLTFAPGQTSQSVIVVVNGDTTIEADESFSVNLSNSTGATIASGQGVGTIVNDDVPLPTLTINDASAREGNSGTSDLVFTVVLSQPSTQTVTVNFAMTNGTAKNGSDYVRQSGTLTFTPGQTSATVIVKIKGDNAVEGDETFFVKLSTPTNASLAAGQAVGTILNDDGAGGAARAQDVEPATTPADLALGLTFDWLEDKRARRAPGIAE